MDGTDGRPSRVDAHDGLKPQSVVLTLLAEHLLERDVGVFAGSLIGVLERLGLGEHATRAALSRMTKRGLLDKRRMGRKTYLHLTERGTAILQDGRQRIWLAGAVNTERKQTWTMLTFSLPEAWQRQRYDLRARLSWAGFGSLQNGVWLCPREVDVAPILAELSLTDYVRVFHGKPAPATPADRLVRELFDLRALAARYREFLDHWRATDPAGDLDALSLTLELSTHWLRIIRDDPRVPVHLLPDAWPAIEAQKLFRTLHKRHQPAARKQAAQALETIAI